VDEVLDDGVEEGCCNVVVVEPEEVLPCVVSAATNENSPARPMAAAIIQRLIRESSARPRSRVGEVRGVMAPMVGAARERTLSHL
jgi:hypothetical protein